MSLLYARLPRHFSLAAHRWFGAWLFVALVLCVSAERRLAEWHFNLRSTVPWLESDDRLDSDEIKIRLIATADSAVPVLPKATIRLSSTVHVLPLLPLRATTLELYPPRAPPHRRPPTSLTLTDSNY